MKYKIRFKYPYGTNGWSEDLELPYIPRKGEEIEWKNGNHLTVHVVEYTPFENDFDVYIVVR